MKLISETELQHLLEQSQQLRFLEDAGVDNWKWYSAAMQPYYDLMERGVIQELASGYEDAE